MTYPPPFSPAPYSPVPPATPAPPEAIRRAVNLMYAGAGLAFAYGVAVGATASSLFAASASDKASWRAGYYTGAVIVGLIEVSLWLWMAWKTRAGRSWARVLSTILFGLLCLQTIVVFVGGPTLPKVFIGAEWIVGISALILLWQRESGAYFAATRQQAEMGYRGAGALPGVAPPYPPADYPLAQPYGPEPIAQPPYVPPHPYRQPPSDRPPPPYGQLPR